MGVAVGGGGVVGVGVAVGRRGVAGGGVVGVGVAVGCASRRRRLGVGVAVGRRLVAVSVLRPGGAGGVPVVVAVHVRAPVHHRHHRQRSDRDRRHPEAGCGRPGLPAHQGDHRGDDRHRAQRGARGVGELWGLRLLEPFDPRDPRDPRDGPRGDRPGVDEGGGSGGGPAALDEHHEPRRELRRGDGDEQPGERGVLGVDADGRGVDRTGAE